MAVTFPAGGQLKFNESTPFVTDGIDALAFDAAVTAGDGKLIVVGISSSTSNRSITSVVDDGSNTYTLCSQGGTDATAESAEPSEVWIYAAPVATNAQTVTVTLSGAVASPSFWFIIEVNGAHATTPIEDVANSTQSSVQTHTVGPLVTAAADSGLVAISFGSTGTWTNPSGWTQIENGAHWIGSYRTIGAASTSYTLDTTPVNETSAMAAIAIAPAAVGGGVSVPILIHSQRLNKAL